MADTTAYKGTPTPRKMEDMGDGTFAEVVVVSGAAAGTGAAIAGDTAHDAADAGNPVKVGGFSKSSLTTPVTTGDRVNEWFGIYGTPIIGAYCIAGADATVNGLSAFLLGPDGASGQLATRPALFNGTTWDRERGNVEATLLASTARTATTSSADQTNYNGRGCTVVVDFTVETDAGVSFTAKIEGKDALSTKYYTILESAAITGVGTTVLVVFPGAVAVANLVANALLPRVWRVTCTPADAKSATYSVGAVTSV